MTLVICNNESMFNKSPQSFWLVNEKSSKKLWVFFLTWREMSTIWMETDRQTDKQIVVCSFPANKTERVKIGPLKT